MRDVINLFSVHQKQRAQLLWNLQADPTQIRVGGWLAPQPADLSFLASLRRTLNAHHDPLLISAGPNRCVRESIMERPKNCFRFVDFQLIDREPKGGHSAFLEATIHQREKFLGIKIDRTRHFWRRRFSRNDIVLSLARLEEEPGILDERVHARIAEGIGIIDTRIRISEPEYFFRNVHDIHYLDVSPMKKRVRRGATPVANKQHVF